MWDYVLYAIIVLIVIFLAIIIIRAISFKPKNDVVINDDVIEFDGDKAVYNLQQLVKCKTISYKDSSLEDEKEFEKLVNLLPELYPNVFKVCSLKKFDGRALLFKWEGKKHDKPSVMMSHYDVVPVSEELWVEPPFAGVIKDGVLWGRGTLDTKVTLNGALTAANHLIEKGFVPENDVYFAFSGSEEINGVGAKNIVDYFEQNGIAPELVVDEGGAVVSNVFPGVKSACGLIGIAEKGMVDVVYKTKSNGGHASAPKPKTPVGTLSKACVKMEKHPFKMHVTKPVQEMFDTLGRHSSFLYKLIFANMWCFSWVIDLLGKLQGGEINALVRTTVAFTQMRGSSASNVIPPEAEMVSNIRINPHDTVDSVIDYVKKTVGDDKVEISKLMSYNPSRISQTDCKSYNKVASAVASTYKGAIVSPYLMVQCSDSRHYGRISDKVYRFSASDFTAEERSTIHGNNERIRLETIKSATEFYIRLLKSC
ncbi:MAG: M20/M25/M40 family metallo-hydrolase [Clostridia bacterium]|nr:M20/M25/M40 family metallo-hydrolase [Clostridia bacterium]